MLLNPLILAALILHYNSTRNTIANKRTITISRIIAIVLRSSILLMFNQRQLCPTPREHRRTSTDQMDGIHRSVDRLNFPLMSLQRSPVLIAR